MQPTDCPTRAAQYVRMSTEKQVYSTFNQKREIHRYAQEHGFEIVRTYADEGRSGLHLKGRKGLQQMLGDVLSPDRSFDAILVYDISRWGRFQDVDESAHYEFLCRQAGVAIIYCAEAFPNDGSMFSALMKSMKRAMAGEYSRELSTKVSIGHLNMLTKGFHVGGRAPYGLRRQLLDRHGRPKALLSHGDGKSLQNERVVLVPGPPGEVETVQRIFRLYVSERMGPTAIADRLNSEGVCSGTGERWLPQRIEDVLRNEKYVGTLVYGRKSGKLKTSARTQPRELWIRVRGAHEPIIDARTFRAAQRRYNRPTDREMLDRLAALAKRHGHLSGELIDASPAMRGTAAYRNRFGSLAEAYARIGWSRGKDMSFVQANRQIRSLRAEMLEDVTRKIDAAGGRVEPTEHPFTLRVDNNQIIAIAIARCIRRGNKPTWITTYDHGAAPEMVVYGFMDQKNEGVSRWYLLPRSTFHATQRTRYLLDDLPAIARYRVAPSRAYAAIRRRAGRLAELGAAPLGRRCR